MSAFLDDYVVEFRTEQSIADTALRWRRAAGAENRSYFNIVEFVENVLQPNLKKGALKIEFFEGCADDKPAYVKFGPPASANSRPEITLHIDKEIWELARLGEPGARYVVAHEIGHILLHDHHAKAFSSDPSLRTKIKEKEHSAEWQAETFGGHFLLPTRIVAAFNDVRELARACSVEENLARARHDETTEATARKERYKRSQIYIGEACGNCGNFTLVASGMNLLCDTCRERRSIEFFGCLARHR